MTRKIWLTSDTHFDHAKMHEYCNRPFDYEEKIFKGLSVIPEDDILIHLGDICMGNDEEVHEKFIMSLSCRKWLVKGNHDHKSNSWYLDHGWDFVAKKIEDKYFGKKILFSHKPTIDIGYDLNMHGHFHNSQHHLVEPEIETVLNNKQHLIALEYTNYQSVLLKSIIDHEQI